MPRQIAPTPMNAAHHRDSSAKPTNTPTAKLMSIPPRNTFLWHIKPPPAIVYAGGGKKVLFGPDAGVQDLRENGNTVAGTVAAVFRNDEEGQGVLLAAHKARKKSMGLYPLPHFRGA